MAEKKETPAAPPDQISLEVAGRLLKVSAERVRQLIKDGYIPRVAPGRTTVVGAVHGYIAFRDDADRRATKSAADSRVRDARALEIEQRVALRNREIIPLEDAVAALDFLAGKVREELTGMPARVTRDLGLRRTLEAEVNGSLKRIAEAVATSADVVEAGGDLPYTSATNDA